MQADQARFLADFYLLEYKNEYELTRKVLAAVPEDRRDYHPDARSRTALELAWHIVSSEIWCLDAILSGHFGPEQERLPAHIRSIADILEWQAKNVPGMLERVPTVPAEQLAHAIPCGAVWNYPAVMYLGANLVHNAHHRGQLTVYLGLMGVRPPSLYGCNAD